MFDICLFDLDDTLIRTEDLKDVREACKNNNNQNNLNFVRSALASRSDRIIYSFEFLISIRSNFPNLKLGVFTRSPRSYAETALNWAYPGFTWDILLAYENVERTKPYGDGIHQAMDHFEVDYLNRVILVGDSDVDIRAAYNAGCIAVLDRGAWPRPPLKLDWAQWDALGRIPDAVISSPQELLDVLENPCAFLPELERVFEDTPSNRAPRFDKINHFIPQSSDRNAYPIYVCGRSFSNYESLRLRKKWHTLTESIGENKESDVFPDQWIKTVRTFIEKEYSMVFGLNIVVAVIPHRPGRTPRLENFLRQLEISVQSQPIKSFKISFQPQLLAYKKGVKSQHIEHLDRHNRFINVRDHLVVQSPELVKPGISYLIIDDVTTTGASLIYASKYLKDAGAYNVKCLSMAKNISNVLRNSL